MRLSVHAPSVRQTPYKALRRAVLWGACVLLSACASTPRDGPPSKPPSDLAQTPDAEPKLEPIRVGGPNRPYEVGGHEYVPLTRDTRLSERGLASWYGRQFHGRRTASGEVYNMYAMSAAHKTMPIPSYARVRNPANGREIVVRINDRGPFPAGRVIDLSYAAALKLGVLRGVAPVEVQRITFDEIRSGTWRRDAAPALTREAPAQTPAQTPTRADAAIDPPAPRSPPQAPTAPVVTADASPDAMPPLPMPTIADPPAARAIATQPRGFWVQLGVFRVREGADGFQQRVAGELDWLAPLLGVFSDAALFRLQAGPYTSRDEAQGVASRIRNALQLVPLIVERR